MIAPFKGDYDDRIFERCIHELPSVSYAFLSSGSYHVAPGAIEPGTACFPAGCKDTSPSFFARFSRQESIATPPARPNVAILLNGTLFSLRFHPGFFLSEFHCTGQFAGSSLEGGGW